MAKRRRIVLPKNERTKGKKKNPFRFFLYDFIKITGFLPALIWLRPKISYPFGRPSLRGGLLLSCNHSTWIDPIIIQLAAPFRRLNSLATKDLFNGEKLTAFFNLMQCIIVDKDNFSLASFHEVVERLGDRRVVLIFPEGSINVARAETMLGFKSGIALMAHKSGAPIVPMYIMRRKKWYHRQRLAVGMPLYVGEHLSRFPSMEELTGVCDLLREKELELQRFLEAQTGTKTKA